MKTMKHYTKISLFSLFILAMAGGCQDEDKPDYAQPQVPVWTVNSSAYSVSMTAIVSLPPNLAQYAQDNDLLAAFSGEECRGIGEKIGDLYYVSIQAMPEEDFTVQFVYYSARNKYLYTTGELFPFEMNGNVGSVDEPEVLQLAIINQL
jgi:hypothetical protein